MKRLAKYMVPCIESLAIWGVVYLWHYIALAMNNFAHMEEVGSYPFGADIFLAASRYRITIIVGALFTIMAILRSVRPSSKGLSNAVSLSLVALLVFVTLPFWVFAMLNGACLCDAWKQWEHGQHPEREAETAKAVPVGHDVSATNVHLKVDEFDHNKDGVHESYVEVIKRGDQIVSTYTRSPNGADVLFMFDEHHGYSMSDTNKDGRFDVFMFIKDVVPQQILIRTEGDDLEPIDPDELKRNQEFWGVMAEEFPRMREAALEDREVQFWGAFSNIVEKAVEVRPRDRVERSEVADTLGYTNDSEVIRLAPYSIHRGSLPDGDMLLVAKGNHNLFYNEDGNTEIFLNGLPFISMTDQDKDGRTDRYMIHLLDKEGKDVATLVNTNADGTLDFRLDEASQKKLVWTDGQWVEAESGVQ